MNVPDAVVIIGVIAIVVLVAIVAWLLADRRRSTQLRERFGPEYDRTVESAGDRRGAEAELESRRKRVDQLRIRSLDAQERDRFLATWRVVQTRFVDEPAEAVTDADKLIGKVMGARGYPVADFDQRAADVSVNHPQVVDHYRVAHAIAAGRDGPSRDTEDLRQAMVHYRALFSDLLEIGDDPTTEDPSNTQDRSRTEDRPTVEAGDGRMATGGKNE